MPYTKKEDREKFEPQLGELRKRMKEVIYGKIYNNFGVMSKGDLTYLVYVLGLDFFKNRKSYTNISTAISCLNDAAEEIRRRFLNPYEDKVREKNGDVL